MYWHEIINENTNNQDVSITYCPLTESIIGYKDIELGVSGELYNSNLVMYDRLSDSRIPQIFGKAIEGSIINKELETFPIVVTTWKQWKTMNPTTKVLSRNTGHSRDYNINPYPGYDDILRVWFPLAAESDKLSTKDFVLGIEHNNKFYAVKKKGFQDKYPNGLTINEEITVTYNKDYNILETPENIKSFEVYWFAWYAYHPDTELYE